MAELKKGDKVALTSGGYVTIDKELGRGGQGIVYLVDLNGEKKALNGISTHRMTSSIRIWSTTS